MCTPLLHSGGGKTGQKPHPYVRVWRFTKTPSVAVESTDLPKKGLTQSGALVNTRPAVAIKVI